MHAYRVRGHLEADLDPLGLDVRPPSPDLNPASYGIAAEDMERTVQLGGALGLAHLGRTGIDGRVLFEMLRQLRIGLAGRRGRHGC